MNYFPQKFGKSSIFLRCSGAFEEALPGLMDILKPSLAMLQMGKREREYLAHHGFKDSGRFPMPWQGASRAARKRSAEENALPLMGVYVRELEKIKVLIRGIEHHAEPWSIPASGNFIVGYTRNLAYRDEPIKLVQKAAQHLLDYEPATVNASDDLDADQAMSLVARDVTLLTEVWNDLNHLPAGAPRPQLEQILLSQAEGAEVSETNLAVAYGFRLLQALFDYQVGRSLSAQMANLRPLAKHLPDMFLADFMKLLFKAGYKPSELNEESRSALEYHLVNFVKHRFKEDPSVLVSAYQQAYTTERAPRVFIFGNRHFSRVYHFPGLSLPKKANLNSLQVTRSHLINL